MAKIRVEDIQSECNQSGWKLISTEYINLTTEMHFQCAGGHDIYLPWQKVRGKFNCPLCKQARRNYVIEALPKPSGVTRVLALDQASHTTGFAVFDDKKLVRIGTFDAPDVDEAERYYLIRSWLISMIENLKIDYVGLEGIQFQETEGARAMGVTVFQTLARLQGVLMETCYEFKIPTVLCPTNTWRHHCGVKGRSRADRKRSMQLLAKQWYNMPTSEDEADAIGIGRYVSDLVHNQNHMENWEN